MEEFSKITPFHTLITEQIKTQIRIVLHFSKFSIFRIQLVETFPKSLCGNSSSCSHGFFPFTPLIAAGSIGGVTLSVNTRVYWSTLETTYTGCWLVSLLCVRTTVIFVFCQSIILHESVTGSRELLRHRRYIYIRAVDNITPPSRYSGPSKTKIPIWKLWEPWRYLSCRLAQLSTDLSAGNFLTWTLLNLPYRLCVKLIGVGETTLWFSCCRCWVLAGGEAAKSCQIGPAKRQTKQERFASRSF